MFAANPMEHVLDTRHWEFFQGFAIDFNPPISKYVVLMLLVGLAIFLIYVPLGYRAQSGGPPRGLWWNCFESVLAFVRDNIAKPCIGHDADHYVPFLWTIFLFILFCNLFGLIPFLGSPTASFTVTGVLAIITFFFIHGSAMAKMGVKHYFASYIPHIDIPFGMGYFVVPLIASIEFLGNFIKAFVLAVRLFANMFAGHVVLAFILFFIVMMRHSNPVLFWGVTFSSVIGVTLLSLLELFVAFLQAYVFTFLTALFLGSALHPQH